MCPIVFSINYIYICPSANKFCWCCHLADITWDWFILDVTQRALIPYFEVLKFVKATILLCTLGLLYTKSMKFLKILLPFCAFSGMDEEAPVYCQTENWNKVFINLVGAQKHFIMLINPILCWLVVKKKPDYNLPQKFCQGPCYHILFINYQLIIY